MEQQEIIIALDATKQELIQFVNNIMQKYGLSCYLIEPIFAEMYTQIKITAQSELAQAKAQMAMADAVAEK